MRKLLYNTSIKTIEVLKTHIFKFFIVSESLFLEKLIANRIYLCNFALAFTKISTRNMKLIADSGSTKTDWCMISGKDIVARVNTQGINPFHQDKNVIEKVIRTELLPSIDVPVEVVDAVYFYGAGCVDAVIPAMTETLQYIFQSAKIVEVHSDLVAAARSLFGQENGIACILGTGSNSCLYKNGKITANIPPLGYILGDEGSGAALGRLFFNGIFKGGLPEEIRDLYMKETGYTYSNIINKVYREPLANRFLASVSAFINAHKSEYPQLQELVINNFRAFFQNNIARYNNVRLKVGAIGSIAYYYKKELCKAAELEGYEFSDIEKAPMGGLLSYHSEL